MGRLWVRLTAAFVVVAGAAVVVVALVIGRAVETGFRGYLGREASRAMSAELVAELEAYYADRGNWADVEALLVAERGRHGMGTGGMGRGMMGGGMRYTLYDDAGSFVAGTAPRVGRQQATPDELESAVPLRAGGATVGWLLVYQPFEGALDAAQAGFLAGVQRTLVQAAALAAALALGAGIAFSQLLTRPLHRLKEAAQAVTAGRLGEQVTNSANTPEEIAALTEAFNQMSSALKRAEEQRQQSTADVAHELRTPISVMRGQLQAMLDGVYPIDTSHVAVVYGQTLHLARLVDDLHTLATAETGHLPLRMRALDVAELVKRAGVLFEPLAQDAGLRLAVEAADDLPPVQGDGDRLHQVLANLLSNALRHTEAGGEIRLRAGQAGDRVRLSVTNTGASLTPEQAERVFDRFWQADESRQQGGAGLGLAIARQIVHLHGGRIAVAVEDGETRFTVDLPLSTPAGQ